MMMMMMMMMMMHRQFITLQDNCSLSSVWLGVCSPVLRLGDLLSDL